MKKAGLIALVFSLMLIVSCDNSSESKVTLENLTVSPESISDFQVGSEDVLISVTANYSDGTTEDVTKDSEYTNVDNVSITNGSVSAIAEGSSSVSITYEGVVVELPISTVDLYESITSSVTSVTSAVGSDLDVVFTVTKKDGTTLEVTPDDGLEFSGFDGILFDNNKLKIVDSGSGTFTVTYISKSVDITVDVDDYVFGTRRLISDDTLIRKAVSYSGYRVDQSPNTLTYPSKEEIGEDLGLLKKAGLTFLRLYDTSTHARRTLEVISESYPNDFKVMLGVWLYTKSDTSNKDNWVQVNGALELANSTEYKDIIAAISVGNECMVDWNSWNPVPPNDVKQFIQYIRANVEQPMTSDDNWEPYSIGLAGEGDGYNEPVLPVVKVMDFVAMHSYPIADTPWGIWDWEQMDVSEENRAVAMMDAGFAALKTQFTAVRDALDNNNLADMPIVIGETGWKHTNTGNDWENRCHPVNAKMYYDRIMDWIYDDSKSANDPVACFYFEAFDEPWKSGDDGWGLFDVDRSANYVLYAQDGSPFTARDGEDFTLADAVYQPD